MNESFFDRVYKNKTQHTPDVLSCLSNLSNDEVFTPPEIVNKMLDMLPQELFESPDTTFLDPACKTGVFLREIAKRLLVGLEKKIPNLQERIDHIFHKQLYGVAITELTSLLSRRSVYCSKYPDGRYSVSHFDNPEGNIRFRKIKHTWEGSKCIYCGASKQELDRGEDFEAYAYEFIHRKDLGELLNMKFDVIISNPPYQLNVGNDGGNAAKAKAIYHLFVNGAMQLNPKYIVMITPSRWMTKTTEGIPSEWVDRMLDNNKIEVIHDFPDAADCFPGVSIMGGVSFFKWSRDYNGKTNYVYHYPGNDITETRVDYLNALGAGIVIRDPKAYTILDKIIASEGNYYNSEDGNFSGLVSPKDFFTNKQLLTSSWSAYKTVTSNEFNIKYYLNKNMHKRNFGWIAKHQIPKNLDTIPLNKVYIPAANGSTDIILGTPFYGEPNSVCSQTYLVIGYDPKKHDFSKLECENIISYIKTKFFRFLVSIKKKTQNGPRGVYQFVPMQDFNRSWSDAELYAKYNLSSEEIAYIESMIRPIVPDGGEE